MSETTRTGLVLLAAGLTLGLLAGVLLGASPPGPGLGLWVGAVVAVVTLLVRRGRLAAPGPGRRLAVPMLLFALAAAWRDSLTLRALDVAAVMVTAGLAVRYARSGDLRTAGVTDYLRGLVQSAGHALGGAPVLVFTDIRWPEVPRGRWSGPAAAAGRGLLIALPLLALFGGLFMAADAVFDQMVANLLAADVIAAFRYLLRAAFWTWVTTGLLRGAWVGRAQAAGGAAPAGDSAQPAFTLGAVEIGVALGLLNALFFAFVAVQFRYFFGGAAVVAAGTGLTYAEYARRGFFELVAVAALVLPLLLLGHWRLRRDGPGPERLFRYLAGALLVMLGIIMVSAVQRMRLYQQAFGLTELRLYTTAFTAWLAVLLGWFSATVLRGRREPFAVGALVSGLALLAALHALNPDAHIIRTNAGRAQAGRALDTGYAVSLGGDAVPALLEALPALPEPERRAVAGELLRRFGPPAPDDWRTWTWGYIQARRLVAAHRAELQALSGHP